MGGRVPVSVLIPTRNEIANIRDCIRSVAFAAEVVVVDSLSTDGTAEAAIAEGAQVVPFDWNRQYPKKKNWALENIPWRHEWVLILDADERITPELAKEIEQAISNEGPQTFRDGYYINRRFMFMGGWLRHCGYYPSWNLRLFRHRKGRYEQIGSVADTGSGDNEVHEHVKVESIRVSRLRHDMLHYAYPTIETWVEKHNRYSNWEAIVAAELRSGSGGLRDSPLGDALERKRWLKRMAMNLPFRPLLRFLYHYIICQGFRDGYRGYVFCRLLAWYEFISIAKATEKRWARESVKPRG
jgi:glycosyltransferase involved in cell wall biosynthesis